MLTLFYLDWLFVFLFPIGILILAIEGQRRTKSNPHIWILALSVLAGLMVATCGGYCLFLWDKPQTIVLWRPDCALVCWRYCTTYLPFWGIVTLFSATLAILGGLIAVSPYPGVGALLCLVSGVALLPMGLLNLYAGYLALQIKADADISLGSHLNMRIKSQEFRD